MPLMDPALERLLTAFLGGVLGGLVSPVIAGWFASRTAKINLRGQAELERKKGRREWRRADVQPFLDLAKGRAHAYDRVVALIRREDLDAAKRELEEIRGTSNLYRDVSFAGVVDPAFRDAALARGKAYTLLIDGYTDLDRAAEVYVFGPLAPARRRWYRRLVGR
jgi:hypothetical protein